MDSYVLVKITMIPEGIIVDSKKIMAKIYRMKVASRYPFAESSFCCIEEGQLRSESVAFRLPLSSSRCRCAARL
jgi:hypothetical protein